MGRLIYILPVVVVLWFADNLLSKERTIGWERNCVFDARRRWKPSRQRGVILLGSSTSVDWLDRSFVGRVFSTPANGVLDAHVNGCHQGCTFAEVRRLLQQRRSYDIAIYGTNQFQLCEEVHSKRVLQQRMMLPLEDLPDLLALYGRAEHPLKYMARYAGGVISGAYADTSVLHRNWQAEAFKPRRGARTYRWARTRRKPRGPFVWCSYEPEKVALKRAFSEALLDDLTVLAKRVYLVLLPDKNLSSLTPEQNRAWTAHRALHQDLAARYSQVTLIDLTGPTGARKAAHFRDGFHTSASGRNLQRALFKQLVTAHLAKPR